MGKTAQRTRITCDDFVKLPDDGKRYEVMDGDLIVSPSPVLRHQRIVGRMFRLLADHVETHDLGEVVVSPMDVVFSEDNILQPDVIYLKKGRAQEPDDRIRCVPDLVVEVLSESASPAELQRKADIYARFGVPHYWTFSPLNETAILYRLVEAKYERAGLYQGQDTFEAEAFPDLTIDLSKIWPK